VIPAEGFYEWQAPSVGQGKSQVKQPYFIHRRDNAPVLLAALWELWRPGEGEPVQSCTIIVTEANSVIAPIHDRMPVVLEPDVLDAWLDPANGDTESIQAMLRPAPAADWAPNRVSRRVNTPRNDDADLLTPVADPATTDPDAREP
jgi:putative SOS response-associated peptidase YedK